jgi:hypothetical protein
LLSPWRRFILYSTRGSNPIYSVIQLLSRLIAAGGSKAAGQCYGPVLTANAAN